MVEDAKDAAWYARMACEELIKASEVIEHLPEIMKFSEDKHYWEVSTTIDDKDKEE